VIEKCNNILAPLQGLKRAQRYENNAEKWIKINKNAI
jgi:hypothetical protein